MSRLLSFKNIDPSTCSCDKEFCNFTRCLALEDSRCFNYSRWQTNTPYMFVKCEKMMDWEHLRLSASRNFPLQSRNSSQFAMTSFYDDTCIPVSLTSNECIRNWKKKREIGTMYVSHICRHFWPSLRRLCFSKLKQSHFCSNFSDALLVQTGLYSWYFCATVSTVSSGWKFEGCVGNFPQILCYIQGEVLYGARKLYSTLPLLQLQKIKSPQIIIDSVPYSSKR